VTNGGKMKRLYFKILIIISSLFLCGLCITTVYSQLITNVPPDISVDEIKALVVEDFESSPEWTVETEPKPYTKGAGDEKAKKNPVPVLEVKIVNGAPSDMKPQEWQANDKGTKKEKVLGVNFRFKYPGHNSVKLTPPKPIALPGRAKGLSIWVHGRGNRYYLEAWVKDFHGSTHILKFGSVAFVGWKPLSVEIPEYVPQEVDSYPATKILTVEKFVLRADPSEQVRNTFFFFDQLNVLTQTYEVNFDGAGLEDSFESSKDTEGSVPDTGAGAGAGDTAP
jgi:hypothetical protein